MEWGEGEGEGEGEGRDEAGIGRDGIELFDGDVWQRTILSRLLDGEGEGGAAVELLRARFCLRGCLHHRSWCPACMIFRW